MANDHLANLPHYEAHQALKRTTASQNKMLVGGRYIFHSYLFIPWITDFEYGCNILVLFFDFYLPVTPFMLVYLPRSFIENSVWCAPDVQNGTISTFCWKYGSPYWIPTNFKIFPYDYIHIIFEQSIQRGLGALRNYLRSLCEWQRVYTFWFSDLTNQNDQSQTGTTQDRGDFIKIYLPSPR